MFSSKRRQCQNNLPSLAKKAFPTSTKHEGNSKSEGNDNDENVDPLIMEVKRLKQELCDKEAEKMLQRRTLIH